MSFLIDDSKLMTTTVLEFGYIYIPVYIFVHTLLANLISIMDIVRQRDHLRSSGTKLTNKIKENVVGLKDEEKIVNDDEREKIIISLECIEAEASGFE